MLLLRPSIWYASCRVSEEASFDGHVFHPSFGNEVVAGKLILLQWSLRFASPECELEMPFQSLEIHCPNEEGPISFKHTAHPDWIVYTSEHSILEHRAFRERTELRNQIEAAGQRRVWRNALIVTLSCLVIFALLCMLVSWASSRMVAVIAARVPAAWEKEYGEKLLVELKDEIRLTNDPVLLARLNIATEPLTRTVKGEFQFHIADDPVPNAFAFPGGHVVVNSGLINLVSTEELAGALAHEFAHITQKHFVRQMISGQGPYYITRVFFNRGGLIGVLAVGSHLLLRQSFSREYEREADDVGWRYLVAANINPRGAIELLKKLKLEEDKSGMDGLTKSGFSSHPPTAERIERLEAKWKKMKPQTGFIEFQKPE